MWLLHGTTFVRAESIVQQGPNINFVEPGGMGPAENFAFTVEDAPSAIGDSLTYARGKAAAFPNERGPAIVAVDVPTEIVQTAAIEHLALFAGLIEYDEGAALDELVTLCGGVIQFDSGPALNRLLAGWTAFVKEIRGVP